MTTDAKGKENNDLASLGNKDLAIAVLREVAADRAAPAQSRQAAARSIAEIVGLLGKNAVEASDSESKSLTELSLGELDAEIRRLGSRSGRRAGKA
jgi:hypothetical protein